MLTTSASPPHGYVIGTGRGLAQARPDLKASAGSAGGQLTVFTLAVDGGPPRHTHTREDERSNATARSSTRRQARSCSPPRGCRTNSEASAAPPAACSSSPRGLENYFDASHAATTTGQDSSQVMTIMAEYGIHPS
jgi:hypothetical protein